MHEITARLLSLSHETLRCGAPHFRERKLIPIRTSGHLIVFDVEKISPLYTMLAVQSPVEVAELKKSHHAARKKAKKDGLSKSQRAALKKAQLVELNKARLDAMKVVAREDNFTSGDLSLPDELCTTEKHYENWNKKNKHFPVDKGHSAGSQFRRRDFVEQSDIDTLAGVCPEASATNRNCKGPLETAILKYSMTQTHSYLVQGPIWYGREPIYGKLENGQWIPDALFISCLFLHRKSIQSWTFVMENSVSVHPSAKDPVGSNLREITLDELEYLTNLYLWGNVRAEKFKQRRDDLSMGDWWKEGQPAPKKAKKAKSKKTAKKAKSKKVKKAKSKKAKSKKSR